MKLFFLVIGMVMVLEGLPYAAAPEKMQEWLARLAEVPASALRMVGFASLIGGLILCWMVEKTTMFN